jgi:hypothetical protein
VYAKDRRAGDRFGYTIALDNQQLLVGAPYSAAVTSTTWDFEAGTLEGWSITGDAFLLQPTYGDNSNFRRGYDMKRTPKTNAIGISTNRESSNVVGTYYVGTYEARPGNSADYTLPNSNYLPGNIQGDGPTGTMISQVFTIRGTMISFLMGGGCDMVLIYVALVVDGMEVSRVTGDCTDYMERRYFEVTPYFGRSAQIKIVDDSSSNWGHINVDDFKFNWEVTGALVNGTEATTNRVVYGGMVETPQAGAAYAFRRHVKNSKNNCANVDHTSCIWEQESKLMASDKRAYAHFGSSLAVNDAAGVLAVGAPHASLTGFFKEELTVYPFQAYSTVNIAGTAFPVRTNRYDVTSKLPFLPQLGQGVSFPISMARDDLFVNLPSYAFQISAAKAMAVLDIIEDLDHNPVHSTKAGAVYIFRKEHSQEALGSITVAPHWPFTEHAKMHPPDATPFDLFGSAVALDGRYLVAGAAGQDGIAPTSGAIYAYDVAFAAVEFSKPQYVAIEATDNFIVLTVLRDLATYSGELSLEYATSDLSAIGVDADKFAACLQLPTNQRSPAGCGHYQQTHGIMTIAADTTSGVFTINIMNDLCRQKYFRYLQVTLAVPGSSALQGETVMTRVRIDDDDFLRAACK